MVKDIIVDGKMVGKEYGVVVPLGVDGDYDNMHTHGPSVMYDGTTYKMWYSGFDGKRWRIHYATSDDGIVWSKHGVIVLVELTGVSEVIHSCNPSVIAVDGVYEMWYAGSNGNYNRIHYATSTDGITWTAYGAVSHTCTVGESDVCTAVTPSVMYNGTIYKMWYAGGNDDSRWRIVYATSIDGINWDNHGVVIPLGAKGEADSYDTDSPYVIHDGTTYKMWYAGCDGSHIRIQYATSTDGIKWDKHGIVAPLATSDDNGDVYTHSPYVIYNDFIYKMWYNNFDNGWKIYYTELSETDLIK